jgi:hypothetical protein
VGQKNLYAIFMELAKKLMERQNTTLGAVRV